MPTLGTTTKDKATANFPRLRILFLYNSEREEPAALKILEDRYGLGLTHSFNIRDTANIAEKTNPQLIVAYGPEGLERAKLLRDNPNGYTHTRNGPVLILDPHFQVTFDHDTPGPPEEWVLYQGNDARTLAEVMHDMHAAVQKRESLLRSVIRIRAEIMVLETRIDRRLRDLSEEDREMDTFDMQDVLETPTPGWL